MLGNFKTALVVAAHPDDEVLGCGGFVASHNNEIDFHLLIMGEGPASRDSVSQAVIKKMDNQIEKARSIIGFSSVTRNRFPDNQIDSVPLLDVVKAIEKVKLQCQPDVVFTHHGGDLNIDHRIVSQAVLTAFRPLTGSLGAILSFEVLSSTEYVAGSVFPPFIPNFYVDITDGIEAKKDAMLAYQSELQGELNPRNPEGIEILARKRGLEVGLRYSEAFQILRWIA